MKVIIIDDETCARGALRSLIKMVCDDATIVGEAETIVDGLRLIKLHKPSLVFLDVEMPEYDGFHLLNGFTEIDFEVVITTAHTKYALKAFGVAAGYLLKPISLESLSTTINMVRAKLLQQKQRKGKGSQRITPQKFALPIAGGMEFLKIKDVLYLKADGSYTRIYMLNGTKHLIAKKMKTFENLLKHPFMYRSHRSFLINLMHVKQFIRNEGGYIVMENNDVVNLARDKRDHFLEKIEALL
jgi:two-component system LytT family response regulator